MLIIPLKELMRDYRLRTGKRMNYVVLAERMGMNESSLRTIAAPGGSTTLHTLEKIGKALEIPARDALKEVTGEEEERLRAEIAARRRERARKKKSVKRADPQPQSEA